jgi:uncharacterized membrane protein
MEKRGRHSRVLILLVFVPFLVFSALQFITPYAIQKGVINDLSGLTYITDNKGKIKDLGFPWTNIYQVGDAFCHQRADRSFIINDNQMPFCARCTAILIGITMGIAFMIFFKIDLDTRFFYLILIGIIPIGIDGIGQLFGLWESNNLLRAITGLLIGFICGIAISVIIDEFKQIIKKKHLLTYKKSNNKGE